MLIRSGGQLLLTCVVAGLLSVCLQRLQALANVHNSTDEDWDGVELMLVSGAMMTGDDDAAALSSGQPMPQGLARALNAAQHIPMLQQQQQR